MANSDINYGTVDGFKTYHTARGRDISAYTDDVAIAAALVVASEWVDGRYRPQFPGWKVGLRLQVREWPRIGGLDIYGYSIASTAVPDEIANATYEAALRNLQSPGSLSVDYTPPRYTDARVEGAVAVRYFQFSQATAVQTQIQIINEILAPILTGGNASSALSGGSARA